jgi:hypothetical protein
MKGDRDEDTKWSLDPRCWFSLSTGLPVIAAAGGCYGNNCGRYRERSGDDGRREAPVPGVMTH